MSSLSESLFEFQPPTDTFENEQVISRPYNYWMYVFTLLIKNKLFIFTLFILLAIVLLAFIVPYGKEVYPISAQYDPASPSWHHWFGIGNRGEDFWNTIWNGTRTTIIFGLILMCCQLIVGLTIGMLWGYGIFHDRIWSRVVRAFSVIPSMIVWIFIIFLFSVSGRANNVWIVVLGISICSWPGLARTVRDEIRGVTKSNLNMSSVAIGMSKFKIFSKNIFPNILPVIFRFAAFTFPEAIAVDSTLSFFNLSYIETTDRSTTSLGNILTTTLMSPNWERFPHLIIIPICMIVVVPLSFNYFSRAISRSLNPSSHVR